MIGECFDGPTWGSNRRALNARKKREAELKEAGFRTYNHDRNIGLQGSKSFYLFAFDSEEDHYLVRPRTPERDGTPFTLNEITAHGGMRVEVYNHPDVEPIAYQGMHGTIKMVWAHSNGRPDASVKFDDFGNGSTIVPLHHLIPEGAYPDAPR